MSPFGLARQLGIERGAAQKYVDLYFARYPGVKRFMDNTRLQARENGFVETVYGRRLYLPDIRASNQQLRQAAERSAINAPMQGTAADIIKRAMIAVDAWCRRRELAPARGSSCRSTMSSCSRSRADATARDRVDRAACANKMAAAAAELKVPLRIHIGVGMNWDEAH